MLNSTTGGFLKFVLLKSGHVKIKKHVLYSTLPYGDSFEVEFSHDLAAILGFDKSQQKYVCSDLFPEIISMYKANIYALYPLHYIVCCNLVEESLLGGERVQVLKYFPRKLTKNTAIDLTFAHNDYIKLNVKNFDRINIRIADLTGRTIQCDPDIPTRMQLLFVNTNSV